MQVKLLQLDAPHATSLKVPFSAISQHNSKVPKIDF